ncbi:DNA polymerase III subunit chi [Sphingomonas xinjiangensis]|uniref:DNA polymerase-3 subunit chi n=1 Tax=Sphingomonas xinjiangensis TaxID=643568 RepID=A0A840YKA2_9SPHN|nr:DNA polymerase III subunit chi [Sphingomonas xinjiangensis]MBB5709380.1 DNA polymerase-3 subunit chi [Sphingomonas xinjiangensis]
MQVDFYHLSRTPLERVLPRIAERILATGGRLLVVAIDEQTRMGLDQLLWTYAAASFLPHGLAGGEDDASQPVLISRVPDGANGAQNVALADGVWRDEVLAFTRVFHFFTEDRIREARAVWKDLAEKEGVKRRYWKQDDAGHWEQAV